MKDKLRQAATLIYEEFLEWTLDYIEQEVTFNTALRKLETLKSKIYSYRYDVESHFLIIEFEVMESILLLFLIASMDFDDGSNNNNFIENKLKNDLVKLLNEVEGETDEQRKN